MKADLEPAKDVLRSFLAEIAAVEKIRKSISAPILTPLNVKDRTPDLRDIEFVPAPDSFWVEDNAYTWIYAEAWHHRSLMQRPKNTPVPEYYLQPALPLYEKWCDQERDVVYRGCIIPSPRDVNLVDYLHHLSSCIEEKSEKRAVWIKSLKSFAQFIREDVPLELQGTLNGIFPYKMEIRYGFTLQRTEKGIQKVERGYILRHIDDPEYPIDIQAASDILQNLAIASLEARPNAQHVAAEALGFAWLCAAVGSARLMSQEKIIHATSLAALKSPDPSKPKKALQPEYFINIETFYGFKDIPISKTLYDFLIALPRVPGSVYIFSKPISTLLRTFYDKGVEKSEHAKSLGKITFLTLMSQSTHWFGHRPSNTKIFAKANNH